MGNYVEIHAGHRDRMYDKLLNSPDSLSEHEYLEVLLFSFIPRKNTNPIAHKLLRTFGSLSGVFNASAKELMTVDGIGKSVATKIVAVGKIFQRVKDKKEKTFTWSSVLAHGGEMLGWFDYDNYEKVVVVLINGNDDEIFKLSFDGSTESTVDASISDIVNAIALYKPKKIVVVHNHPSGNVQPSKVDDYTTYRLYFLCKLHGVKLKDHIIVYKNEIFSYSLSNRLAMIEKSAELNDIIKIIKE